MPSMLMIFKKTTAISSEQSLLHLIFTGFEGMSRRHQSSQPISVPCTEQSSGHLGPEGTFQREEEKIWEVHCIRPYPGCASRTLSSLERANEGSKKQKNIVKAGSGSMGHSQNQWSRGGPPGEEPGSSKLPLAPASMNSWELRTTFKCPWLMRQRPGVDKLRKDYRGPWPSHSDLYGHSTVTPAFHFLYVTMLRRIGGSWQTSIYNLSPAFLSLPTTSTNVQMMFTLVTSPSMTLKWEYMEISMNVSALWVETCQVSRSISSFLPSLPSFPFFQQIPIRC